MNQLLRNKWVVGLLAVAAVALLAIQFWPESGPRRQMAKASTPSTNKPAAATTAPASGGGVAAAPAATGGRPTNSVGTVAGPDRSADRDFLTERFEVWRRLIPRDPFKDPTVVTTSVTNTIPYATNLLSLTTLWLQTGSRLAVVNGAIVAEGDDILDYTVESIGYDHIWVFGPREREQVPFGQRAVPRAATGATGRSNSGRSSASSTRRQN